MSIWFPTLLTDWACIKKPERKVLPLVFADKEANRMVITACCLQASAQGIEKGMPLADARAILPELQVIENQAHKACKLLEQLAVWCIRYSPLVAADADGLLIDLSGCAHLWGGEAGYLKEIVLRLRSSGYYVRAAIADTMGTARAVARYGVLKPIIKSGGEPEALIPLPPMALGFNPLISQKLLKLGLVTIGRFINMPRSVLRRRIGEDAVQCIEKALGQREEAFNPVSVPEQYSHRLPCPEPVRTRKAIEIAIEHLLNNLCRQLNVDGLGLRAARLQSYRVDGKILLTEIGTNSPSANVKHLCQLFALKIDQIEPRLGIELFVLDALKTETSDPVQEALWHNENSFDASKVSELIDRLSGKFGQNRVHRYLPMPYHWPESSVKITTSLAEPPSTGWRTDRLRPVQLLRLPEAIQVTAPIPDYPPMVFRYQGQTHYIKKADGPERIEREWWLDEGEHRDYYQVEDQQGKRYWLFRSGHYHSAKTSGWFIHGFFA